MSKEATSVTSDIHGQAFDKLLGLMSVKSEGIELISDA